MQQVRKISSKWHFHLGVLVFASVICRRLMSNDYNLFLIFFLLKGSQAGTKNSSIYLHSCRNLVLIYGATFSVIPNQSRSTLGIVGPTDPFDRQLWGRGVWVELTPLSVMNRHRIMYGAGSDTVESFNRLRPLCAVICTSLISYIFWFHEAPCCGCNLT